MDALFLGDHAALDFLNTAFAPDGHPVEVLKDGQSFLEWLGKTGLLEDEEARKLRRRLGRQKLDDAAARARDLREWVRTWLERWRSNPRADYAQEITLLNKYLRLLSYHRELNSDGTQQERPHINDADGLIGLLAAQVATLVTNEDACLVKCCAGPGCTLWFVDRTRGHRRLFCSASVCGNRAKVAAFRDRRRRAAREGS